MMHRMLSTVVCVALALLSTLVPQLAHARESGGAGGAGGAGGVRGWYSQPALAGDRLVFVSEGDLWRADLSDTTRPIVASRMTSVGALGAVASSPVFSPDGEYLAFAITRGGNADVHVMPSAGGDATRLTFHPGADVPLAFTADGRAIAFSSARSNALGRPELWQISRGGGTPIAVGIGECTMVAYSATGGVVAFTPWSNERWSWRRYRGGMMPDIWLWETASDELRRVTDGGANDLFPMWLRGRLWFLSDRDGLMNLFSVDADGGDLRQHTALKGDPEASESSANLDLRHARADALRGGGRIILARGGDLLLYDARDDSLHELDIRLLSDRRGRQARRVDPLPTLSGLELSPDGSLLLVESRGELLAIPVGASRPGRLRSPMQLTRSSGAREWGATFIDSMQLALISDQRGEQQISRMAADGSGGPSALTIDRESWLFPPRASPDGRWLAYGDKTHRLHLLDTTTLDERVVDSSEDGAVWEITDYRFSPDGQWLAYSRMEANRRHAIRLHSIRTQRTIELSDGLSDDTQPRWDPAGRYLYFLSNRTINPILNEFDFDHAVVGAMDVIAVSLDASTPPPVDHQWHAAGLDFDAWRGGRFGRATHHARIGDSDDENDAGDAPDDEGEASRFGAHGRILVTAEGLTARHHRLPIEAGVLDSLEAIPGGVLLLRRPIRGLLDVTWPTPPMGAPDATLERHLLGTQRDSDERRAGAETDAAPGATSKRVVARGISTYALSGDGRTVAFPKDDAIVVMPLENDDGRSVRLSDLRLRVDPVAEWTQIFDEAWRLQRDFYWAPTMGGLDWDAKRRRHAPALQRIGSRTELDDLLRLLLGELATSHAYVWSRTADAVAAGERPENPPGLLGADLVRRGGGLTIDRIYRGAPWADLPPSPLDAPWLNIREGQFILAIDGQPIGGATNPYELLQGRAGVPTRITIADDAMGRGRRVVEVTPIADETPLRYWAWVESNRSRVADASDGRFGYLHLPDMSTDGLIAFNRMFWPQIDREAMIVDVRGNGGGFVSQMLLQRLARRVWAFMQPRHGATETYPSRTLHGPITVLIDQHAGSDGDIFPESFRLLGLGPLIGTRTWGGVVGIRADKPAVDLGVTTQPEFAWWEPTRGWSLENSGVSPDIEVQLTPADRRAGRDPQLERAIAELRERLAKDPMPLPERPPWPVRD